MSDRKSISPYARQPATLTTFSFPVVNEDKFIDFFYLLHPIYWQFLNVSTVYPISELFEHFQVFILNLFLAVRI